MKKLILLAVAILYSGNLYAAIATGATAVDPTSFKMKISKVAVSTDPYCTNPVTIMEEATPQYIDMVAGPEIGRVPVPNGTYPCVIIVASDVIKVTPAANDGVDCFKDLEISFNVCQAGLTTTNLDGTVSTCTSGEDTMTIYLSTYSTASGGDGATSNPFTPPTSNGDASNAIKLNGALVVQGEQANTFIADARGLVYTQSGSGTCDMQPPKFGFR